MIVLFMLSIPFAAAEEPEKLYDGEAPSQNNQERRKRRSSKKSKSSSKKTTKSPKSLRYVTLGVGLGMRNVSELTYSAPGSNLLLQVDEGYVAAPETISFDTNSAVPEGYLQAFHLGVGVNIQSKWHIRFVFSQMGTSNEYIIPNIAEEIPEMRVDNPLATDYSLLLSRTISKDMFTGYAGVSAVMTDYSLRLRGYQYIDPEPDFWDFLGPMFDSNAPNYPHVYAKRFGLQLEVGGYYIPFSFNGKSEIGVGFDSVFGINQSDLYMRHSLSLIMLFS